MSVQHQDKADGIKNKSAKKQPARDRKKKKPKKISERYLYNSGLAYLQRFPASSSHFRSVMMRKIQKSCYHHSEQNIEDCTKLLDDLILKFQNLSLLDDAAYLKGMVTSLRRRGLSSLQINIKLRQKGYDTDDIKTEVKKHDQDEYRSVENGDIFSALVFARKKKLGPYDIDKKKTPEKSLGIMARAGYSFDIANKTLDLSLEEIDKNFKNL